MPSIKSENKKKVARGLTNLPPSNRFPAIVHIQPLGVAPQRCSYPLNALAKLALFSESSKYFLNYF